ncbi:Reverse transcriptase domain [Trinorchestia longiramus]|nr:Reverse transcriptase domain [Trinorchestia longiramus]
MQHYSTITSYDYNRKKKALADTVSKIFCGILNERMKHVVEEQGVMGEEQNGFRRDRRGEDNLFVVSEVIERKRKENKKVYLAFLDIEKAYDRVDRRRLLDALGKIGFSEKIVNIVKSLYENTCAVYRLGNLVTGQVRSVRGVRQGCTLSPLLFGLYTEELAVRLRMSGFGLKVGEEKLSCLLYADDIAVVSESEQETDRDREWNIGEVKIGRTKEYKYLGCMLSEDGCARAKGEKVVKAMQWC